MSRCELSRAQAVFERQAAACCDVLCAREARFVGESNVATSGKNYEQSQSTRDYRHVTQLALGPPKLMNGVTARPKS
jgi:hypothetical protein